MSILTKVFIVLLVVFSIAFTSVEVAMVAQTTNWKDTAEKYREHARVADTNLRHEIAANAALLATARDDVRRQLEEVSSLRNDLKGAREKLAPLKRTLDIAVLEKGDADAMNLGLLAQLQVAEAARGEYRKQRDGLEGRSIDLQQRNIDLSDRVNELTARISVLMEQRRQFEQQISILRAENDRLAQNARTLARGATLEAPTMGMSRVVAVTPVATRAIHGKVVEVSGNLVTVSVGGADGVQKGMILVIHRGDQYVGDIKVNLVDPNQSAGRIIQSTRTPAPGDEITDARWLSGSRG